MDEENGLELSLALSCGGGSTAASKAKSSSSPDTRTDEGDRGSKLIDDFKSFLHGGTQKPESSQLKDPVKHEENFFNNLSKAVVDIDASTNLNSGGFWNPNTERSAEAEQGKRPETGNKRKSLFEEINQPKKSNREAHTDLHDKARVSHISINMDDGSAAENEDVADSEADGSTSRMVIQRDDSSKLYNGVTGLSDVPKDVYVVSDSSSVDLQGQKRISVMLDKEFKLGNMPYGVQFSSQAVNMTNLLYPLHVKESNPSLAHNTSNYPLTGMLQVMAAPSSERPGTQPVMPANMPMMLGYSPMHLPTLEKDNSRGLLSHSPQFHPSYTGRGPPISEKKNDGLNITQGAVPVTQHKLSDTIQHDGRVSDRAKGDGKHTLEEGSSSRIEEDAKGSSLIFRVKDVNDQPRPEGLPSEHPAIRSGIAADLKFGGSGSYPNLPWVSTTAPGPNGRTISGVTYRYSEAQIRIVCACHGSHMSPEEFIQHASEEQPNPDADAGLTSFPSSNPAASAQS